MSELDVTIRSARNDESEEVMGLWTALHEEQEEMEDRLGTLADDASERWENDFPEWLDDEGTRVLVAEHNGIILGFVLAERWYPPPVARQSFEIYIESMFVRPEHRRRGIGRKLVDAVADWTHGEGADRMRLGVLSVNEEAKKFWRSVGGRSLQETFTIEVE